ncbi:MAG: hypothetical protein ABFS05_00335 [Bacteroidota bacterium]
MKKAGIFILLFIGMYYVLRSQDQPDSLIFQRDKALKIYLDCAYCDQDYFNTNFSSVNYVVERTVADVYIQITAMRTATGGTQYTMVLKGYGRFSSHQDTLVFSVPAHATEDQTRTAILEYTRLGLVPYLMKTPIRERITLFIDEDEEGFNYVDQSDKWRNWYFQVNGGGGINNQKSLESYSLNAGLYVSKVTPEIKFESSNNFSFSEQKFMLYDGDSLIYSNFSSQKELSSVNLFVKSLGNHFGLGVAMGYVKSDYHNLDMQLSVGPAVEYNLYDYALASTKQLRFIYGVDYEYSDYMDTTIYNVMYETRFTHALFIIYSFIEDKWSVNASAFGSNYLNDFTKFSAGGMLSANYSFDTPEGLTVFGSCGFSYVRDQVGLKKSGLSSDELLLGTQAMETDYNYNFNIGFRFSFGSMFNNVVNPRFDF